MLSRKYRISSEVIKKMFNSKTESVRTDLFFVKFGKNNLPHPRFAVIVPKKVYKTAVSRHRVKRKIVALLKDVLESINTVSSNDYVISIREKTEGKSDEEISEQLAKILN